MANLFVGVGGFATIQDAIDAADIGDHILVSAGVYDGFSVDKAVTIEGQGDVRIVGSFRDDNGIPLNTSVADFLSDVDEFDAGAGNGITVYADGVTLSNLHVSSFVNGIVFSDADDLVLDHVDISDTVVGVFKDGEGDSSGFRMWGGSISDSYMGASFGTFGGGGPETFLAPAIFVESPPFDDVILDGVAFTNITFKGIYAEQLSHAQLLNLVMTNVGQFGQGPAFGSCWEVGQHAAGIDINIDSGRFDDIVISGFVMRDVGAGSAPESDGAAITVRAAYDYEEYFGAAAIAPPMGSIRIENGIIQGSALAFRLGTDGGEDDIWSDVSIQNILINGYLNATIDNQSYQSLVVGGTTGADHLIAAETTEGQLSVYGMDGNDQIAGGWNDDLLNGGAGNDVIFTRGGVDEVIGGTGNDGVYFGRYFNQKGGSGDDSPPGGDSPSHADAAPFFHFDSADGGEGTDTFALQGNYFLSVLSQVVNFEVLLVASGADPSFDFINGRAVIDEDGPESIAPPIGNPHYFYNLIAPNSLVAPGTTFTVKADGLQVGETLIFNGSAEHDGAFRIYAGAGLNVLVGGDGNDGFMYGTSPIGLFDRIDGGAGIDTIAFRGNFTGGDRIVFQGDSFRNIENIGLCSGHTNEYGGAINPNGFDYDVTMADGNVAAGQQLGIIAGLLRADESLNFDGSKETNGSFRVISGAGDDHLLGGEGNDALYGGLGADVMIGGNGADVYVYRSADESTAAQTDWITLGAGDKIDLSAIGAGTSFSFIGTSAFHHVANELRLFQTDGHWVAQGDVNGDGIADLVININSPDPVDFSAFVP